MHNNFLVKFLASLADVLPQNAQHGVVRNAPGYISLEIKNEHGRAYSVGIVYTHNNNVNVLISSIVDFLKESDNTESFHEALDFINPKPRVVAIQIVKAIFGDVP